jgi:hypothetical protein
MKGKITSILFCLMLVFGLLIASCDNGATPKDPTFDDNGTKTDLNKTVLDFSKQGAGEEAVNSALKL